jgi:crotonobetainyl-CoA:carnitine CoA-transferase CaiB-like acyl-CoA transferase
LGAHTGEVLAGLGVSDAEMATLESAGVIARMKGDSSVT